MAEKKTDLDRAVAALVAKGRPYGTLWNYYDGDQPLHYSTDRLREAFNTINVRFIQNWCGVVVNTILDKLVLKRFVVGEDKKATKRLNELWWETEMKVDDDDVHLGMLVTGESFAVVWREGAEGPIDAYYNDPRMCHIEYDEERPRVKSWAAKWWQTAEKRLRLTMYYPGKLEYYETTREIQDTMSLTGKAFEALDVVKNPFGMIPVFHFRRTRRGIYSELTPSVVSLQDAVNKLLADMMVAAEYGAFKQRYIISNADTQGRLKNAPNEIWDLPAGDGFGQDTSVGEFEATDLGNYVGSIEKLATSIAATTQTPRHYFIEKAGSNPSGEALMAMEASLNTKVDRYIERLQFDWSALAQFMLRLDGVEVGRQAIETIFRDPRTLQPMTQAQARNTNVAAGMPLRTVVREEGWSDDRIARMEADRREELAAEQAGLAEALLEQQRRFDQGDPPPLAPPTEEGE